MKLGIIFDSSSGITKDEANRSGWGYLPIYLTIDGKEYKDGIDLNNDNFYKMININQTVKSAATDPGTMHLVFEEMSKKFDEVIYIPLSKDLSSQSSTATTVASEFDNIHVLSNTNLVAEPAVILGRRLEEMNKKGKSIEELLKYSEFYCEHSRGMIVPETLTWLKSGGRIKPSVAAMGNLLGIIPMLYFDGAIHKHGKGRVPHKTLIKGYKFLEGKHHKNDYTYLILEANADEIVSKAMTYLEPKLGYAPKSYKMPRTLTVHVGPGTTAVYCIPKE